MILIYDYINTSTAHLLLKYYVSRYDMYVAGRDRVKNVRARTCSLYNIHHNSYCTCSKQYFTARQL